MTREEAKQLLPIIQAWAEGKDVQAWDIDKKRWYTFKDAVLFTMPVNEYRIKPETKYRPFKDAEECWQEMQEHHPFGWMIYKTKPTVIRSIASLYDDGVEPYDTCNSSYKEALQIFTFADGQPFGVKEENA